MDINNTIRAAFEYYQAGNLDLAEQFCKKILKKQPNNMNLIYFLGLIYYQSQCYDAAIQYIEKFLKFNPTNSEAYYNLGRAYERKGETDKAVSCYQKALKYKPTFLDAVINLGNLFHGKRQLDEALEYYRRATEIDSKYAGAYYNIGVILQEKEQPDEAISAYRKAIQLKPDYADAYHDLGYTLQDEGRFEEAIQCYQRAVQIAPTLFDAYNNLGRSFQETGKLEEAIKCYQEAVRLNPNFADAHVNMSMVLLLYGNFKEGWKEYDWRWKLRDRSPYDFARPLWDGSDISGRTIFVYCEQGFGDTIQFIRYVPLVAQRGAKVIVECQRELKSLMEHVEGMESVIARDDKLPEFDVHCPLLSLPMILGTELQNIPAKIPYMSTDPGVSKKWRDRIQAHTSGLKIGLVWSGNPKFKNDRRRSCELKTFSPLATIEGITFFSLQKGEAAEQAKIPPEGMKIVDFTDDIEDFGDTAGLIENLDLVISVDTSAAHLTGAIGKPVWTLIPYSPDWRWMLERDDSSWYPTMRLLRQPSPGDWDSVIRKMASELINMDRTLREGK